MNEENENQAGVAPATEEITITEDRVFTVSKGELKAKVTVSAGEARMINHQGDHVSAEDINHRIAEINGAIDELKAERESHIEDKGILHEINNRIKAGESAL